IIITSLVLEIIISYCSELYILKRSSSYISIVSFIIYNEKYSNKHSEGKLLNYQKLIEEYPKSTEHSMGLQLFVDITEDNKQLILNDICDVIKFFQNRNIKDLHIAIRFWNEEFAKNKIIESTDFTFPDDYEKYVYAELIITSEEYALIKNPQDLIKYIVYMDE
ncbi:hypothetical protein, partial [Tepidibacter sp. Z1-5]|uniref:hypothetical protein n=1 Tax=Tepidibacter sp. Z1-5 TaxID=3134138 RepID=UPI0030C378F9